MKTNIGSIDRVVRIIAGVTLIALAATGIISVWGYFGVVPLLTAFVRFCPAYLPFGINTCTAEKQK